MGVSSFDTYDLAEFVHDLYQIGLSGHHGINRFVSSQRFI